MENLGLWLWLHWLEGRLWGIEVLGTGSTFGHVVGVAWGTVATAVLYTDSSDGAAWIVLVTGSPELDLVLFRQGFLWFLPIFLFASCLFICSIYLTSFSSIGLFYCIILQTIFDYPFHPKHILLSSFLRSFLHFRLYFLLDDRLHGLIRHDASPVLLHKSHQLTKRFWAFRL